MSIENEIKKLERRVASWEADEILANAEEYLDATDSEDDEDMYSEDDEPEVEETEVEEEIEPEPEEDMFSGEESEDEGSTTHGDDEDFMAEDEEKEESEDCVGEDEDKDMEDMISALEEEILPKKTASNKRKATELQTFNKNGVEEIMKKQNLSDRDNGQVSEKGPYIKSVKASVLKEASARLDKLADYLQKSGNKKLATRVDMIANYIDYKREHLED